MSEHERRADWTIVAAIALIGLGVWFLLGNVIPGFTYLVRRAAAVAWPLALIALGVLLYLSAQRGAFRGTDVRGKRLYRSRNERMVGGVLGGLGAYLSIDPTWLRVGFLIFGVLSGVWAAVVLYVVAMIIIPEEPAGGWVEPPAWPGATDSRVSPPPSTGWPHTTGKESVQTPPPSPPAAPGPPNAATRGEHGPTQS